MSVRDLKYPGNGAGAPVRLPAPAASVDCWWCDVIVGDRWLDELAGWLSQAEHARARRFSRAALARRYIAGRAALRWVLGQATHRHPADVEIVRGVRGRPHCIDGPDFNVSNTTDVALIGVCAHASTRIGVDVEHGERAVAHDRLSRKFLTPDENARIAGLDPDARRRAFLRLWTCKEAMSKATGDALSAPLREMNVAHEPALRLVDGPAPYRGPAWTLLPVAVPAPFIATAALWRPDAM